MISLAILLDLQLLSFSLAMTIIMVDHVFQVLTDSSITLQSRPLIYQPLILYYQAHFASHSTCWTYH